MKNLLYFQKFKTVLILFILSVFFQSCKKQDINPIDAETLSVKGPVPTPPPPPVI